MTYTISIAHHSIASAPTITTDKSLTQAKRLATKEFGDGFIDHKIVIHDEYGLVATRRIGDDHWINADRF